MKFHEITIEYGRGETYSNSAITAYGHGTYPRSSVLAGRNSRTWLDEFNSVEEAKTWCKKNYPDVEVTDLTQNNGCTHISVDVMTNHLPDEPDYC